MGKKGGDDAGGSGFKQLALSEMCWRAWRPALLAPYHPAPPANCFTSSGSTRIPARVIISYVCSCPFLLR